MLTKKKKITTALAAFSMIALVACDTDEIKYPSDYNNKIIEKDLIDKDGNNAKTAQDTLKQYYQSLTNDDAVYEKMVKKTLSILSDNMHNFNASTQKGSATYSVVNDTIEHRSVADNYSATDYQVSDNLLAKAKETMFSTARGGSYKKDNVWDEAKYAKYLEQNYYYLTGADKEYAGDYKITTDEDSLKNKICTPEMKFDDVYSSVNSVAYNKYMSEELYDDMKINYLTTEYIMSKTYASIGNSNARKVQVISIVDRSDEIGDAKKLLDAYIKRYILRKEDNDSVKYQDDDFSILSKLWKGITVDTIAEISNSDIKFTANEGKTAYTYSGNVDKETKDLFARYLVTLKDDNSVVIDEKSPVLTCEQAYWLNSDSVSDYRDTLAGKILVDKDKIEEGLDNWHKIDSSLESTYTGSYTYDLTTGYRNAIDEIATRSLVTEGVYLKSSGISSLPSGLTDRIFSPRVTSSKTSVDKMKNNIDEDGLSKTKEDLTIYAKDGYRYMTVADTLSTDDASSILYYDSSSKTYYITRILDVVDTNALTSTTDSIYDTEEKKTQIAREVAYTMSTTGSYKTDSAVYWFSRMNFTYSDEAFLEYMKSNYKDVFKTENPYSDEAKIDLSKLIVD